jgi:hypothetical protein
MVIIRPASLVVTLVFVLEETHANFHEAMHQLFARRYESRLYKLDLGKSAVRTFTPGKSFGAILVVIGLASYLVPVLEEKVQVTPSHKNKSDVKYIRDDLPPRL